MILDPYIRFEISISQPNNINSEKNKIYILRIEYYKSKYQIHHLQAIGSVIGLRETFHKFFWLNFNLCKESTVFKDSLISIKSSVAKLIH